MFKQVENELETELFNNIWTTVWKEKGYELEYSANPLARFLVMTNEGRSIGTAEINPFSIDSSPIMRIAELHPEVIAAGKAGLVCEIDKIALLPNYRGRYITDLLSSLIYFVSHHRYQYFVSLLEPIFSRALRISYHVPMEQIGPKTYYKGDDVIPVLFDSEQIINQLSDFNWLKMPG